MTSGLRTGIGPAGCAKPHAGVRCLLALAALLVGFAVLLVGCGSAAPSSDELFLDALETVHPGVKGMTDPDRVYALENFGADQCLGWNPVTMPDKPGPLRCFDSSGEQLWTLDLDGYSPERVYGSPTIHAAAALATKWVTPNDQQYRLLIVTTDPEVTPGASADRPAMTMLRELPPPDIGFNSVQVAFAQDGDKIALFVTRTDVSATDGNGSESTLEVIDTAGAQLWQVRLPANSSSFPMVAFDANLNTAAMVLSDPMTDADSPYEPYLFICRSSGETQRFEARELGLPALAQMQEVSLSPDGKLVALKSYGSDDPDDPVKGTVSVCSLGPKVGLEWTAESKCEVPCFSADGRMLVCSYGDYDVAENFRSAQVFSTTDGTVLWEKDEDVIVLDDEQLTDSSGTSMWHFASAFVWHSLSDPDAYSLIDLSGAELQVKRLADGSGFATLLPGSDAMLSIDDKGTVISIPRP
jgi:hypothetical protein